jgi:hypothetical protein
MQNIPDIRDLNNSEKELILWMLENGNDNSKEYINEIDKLSVASKCPCGCPSINFAYDHKELSYKNGMKPIADFIYKSKKANLCGAFLFLLENHVGGLDIYSIDGNETPDELPSKNMLKPLNTNKEEL